MYKVVVPLILIYLFFSVMGDISDAIHGVEETTVYVESCSTYSDDVFECEKNGGRSIITKKEFRVDFRNQLVVDKSSFSYRTHCIVFDKDNWKCGVDDEDNGWESMINASYTSSTDVKYDNHKIITLSTNVGTVRYWKQYFKNFFG